jgi:hypothetical protein
MQTLARCLVAVLMTLTAVGVAAPAHAADKSPEKVINLYFRKVQTGTAVGAVQLYEPKCRAQRLKPIREAMKVIADIPTYVFVGKVDVRVNGNTAKIDYSLKYYLNGYKYILDTYYNTRFVRIKGQWYISCNQRGAF